jgi:hypothetical protein
MVVRKHKIKTTMNRQGQNGERQKENDNQKVQRLNISQGWGSGSNQGDIVVK